MIIELLGTPSCGKSTYVKEHCSSEKMILPLDLYLYSDSRIRQNLNKVTLALYAMFHCRRKYAKTNKLFSKIKFTSFTKKIKMWLYVFSVLGAKWKAEKKYAGDDLLFDEGVNQVVWGLLYNEKDSKEQVWALHHHLVPEMGDRIIHFIIDREVLYERLMNRNNSGGSELEHEVKTNPVVLDQSIGYIESIVEKLKLYDLGNRIEDYFGEDI